MSDSTGEKCLNRSPGRIQSQEPSYDMSPEMGDAAETTRA
jgi:hypothetical protein